MILRVLHSRLEDVALVVAAAGIAALCIALYWNGLGGPLILDDYPQLSPILELSPLAPTEWAEFLISSSGPLGRPIAMLSFLVDSWLAGPDLMVWKATNLAIHLLCGAAAWGLARELALVTGQRANAAWFALALAALWLLHPLQVSTVLYTVQRMTQLAALFSLAGLWSYAFGRRRQLEGRGGDLAVALAFVLFLPLAALSKESGLLLPLMMLSIEAIVFRGVAATAPRRRLAIAYAITLAVVTAIGAWLFAVGDGHGVMAGAASSATDAALRLLTQARVLLLYVGQILLPSLGRMGFHHDDLVPSLGLLDPPSTLPAVLAILGIVAAAYGTRGRAPLVSVGLALFLVGHLLESTVLPLEPMFEHRNYLPSFGLLLAAAAGFAQLPLPRRVALVLAVLMLALACFVSLGHVARWSSAEALASYAAQVHPRSPRVRADAAARLAGSGRVDDALAVLADSTAQGARIQAMCVRCQRDRRLESGELAALGASLRSPFASYEASGVMRLGDLGLDGACAFDRTEYMGLIATIERLAIRDRSNRAKLALWRAHYAWAEHDPAQAFAALADAGHAAPDWPVPSLLAAMWSAESGQLPRARAYLDAAGRIADPRSRRYRELFSEVESAVAAAR